MARKVTVPDTVQLSREEFERLSTLGNLAQDEGLAASPTDDEDEIRALKEIEGADETKWQIFRTLPPDKAGFLGSTSSALLSLEYIGKHYGPGRYKVKGVRSTGQYVGQRTVSIAEVPEELQGTRRADGESSGVQDVLAIIERNESKRRESFKEWAMILAPVLGPVLQTWLSNSRGTTLNDLTGALANMKALAGGESQVSKIEELGQLITVVKGIAGDAVPATGRTWVDAVVEGAKEVGPALAGLVASRGVHSAPGVQFGGTPAALSAPVAPPPSVSTPAPPAGDPMMTLLQWLQGQMPLLISMAARDRDPTLYAEVLLDMIPEGVDPAQLRTILSRPDWWLLLSNYFKPCAPYQGWFEALRGALLQGLTPETPAPDGGVADTHE